MCLWPCWWRRNKLRRLEVFAVSPLWSLDISWCVLYDCVKYFHYTRRVTSKHWGQWSQSNNLTWGPHFRDLCKTTVKKVYQSAKIKHFLNFHARKTFFQAHIQSGIDYASTLWDSASDSLQKTLKSLHRQAIKIVLLKRTSLTDKDYKSVQILPLSSRLMSNKARFVPKIVSGRAPMYLSGNKIID